ncbi:ATP-binding protein [Virgibacillus siamensis]|uniref:ATP-binding protein n=1 Tax=Virgibacillus siamensis TaxID=480071 RepID=UPI000986AEB9|nr:ATP-binding protein [Virgibacillus siamensis]
MESRNNKYNNINMERSEVSHRTQIEEFFSGLASLPTTLLEWIDKNSNDIVTVWEAKGKLVFISNSVKQLLGYQPAELLGSEWHENIAQEDVEYLKKNFDVAKEGIGKSFNLHIRDRNGKYIWTEHVISRVKDKSGENYYISILKDITDKKEAEEMMVRSEKMSVAGQLAAGIAHEIRNPLTSLKGFLQLLQAGVNRKEEYYKIMIEEIEKMETITSELLFISKPLTDNKRVESISSMIEDVITLLKPQASLKNVELIGSIPIDFSVYCDRSQIKQVLINLVKNAIEAMDDPGEIHINVSVRNQHLAVEVIDQGVGVPEELIHKLGEPFFTTKQNGTGLGIMIIYQILEKHDGKLEILRNESKGSTFRIQLPYED